MFVERSSKRSRLAVATDVVDDPTEPVRGDVESPIYRLVCPPGVPGPIAFNRHADRRARAKAAKAAETAAAEAAARRAALAETLVANQRRLQASAAASKPPSRALPPDPQLKLDIDPRLLPKHGHKPSKAPRQPASQLPESKSSAAARQAAIALNAERRDEAARARVHSNKSALRSTMALLYDSSGLDSSQEQSPFPRATKRRP